MLNEVAWAWGLGLWHEHTRTYLQCLSLGALLLFGLPMMLWPLRWAKSLGWTLPSREEETHLAIYFGRTLGMLTCALSIVGLSVLDHPSAWPAFFNLNLLVFVANTGVHIWGALRRIQPASETWEIPVWFALAAAQYLFYPAVQWRLA